MTTARPRPPRGAVLDQRGGHALAALTGLYVHQFQVGHGIWSRHRRDPARSLGRLGVERAGRLAVVLGEPGPGGGRAAARPRGLPRTTAVRSRCRNARRTGSSPYAGGPQRRCRQPPARLIWTPRRGRGDAPSTACPGRVPAGPPARRPAGRAAITARAASPCRSRASGPSTSRLGRLGHHGGRVVGASLGHGSRGLVLPLGQQLIECARHVRPRGLHGEPGTG